MPARDAPDVEISFAKEAAFAPPANDDLHRYTIIPGITHPRSRGTVRLASTDPADPPVIDPNYLSEPADLETLVASIRMTRELGAAPAFEEWNAGEFWPGPGVESDEQIADYIRESISTWFHPVGTCRMGTGDDAVVDPRLAVRGTTGLYVADASIMPDVVSVNTNASSMMIGWHAGDLIAEP
jgi:choline dehydrogenase